MSTDNSEFGRRTAQIADALTQYDHLPPVGLITLMRNGRVCLSPDGWGDAGLVALARWAEAFSTPVVLQASPNHEINTHIEIGGLEVVMWISLSTRVVHELAVRLGAVMVPEGVRVSAEQLLTALHVDQDAARPCNDEQCISSGRAALCATHDTEYFATQRATVSTVEIAAGGAL